MKRRIVFLLSFLMLAQITWAQIDHVGRYESAYNWSMDDFLVIPNGEAGMLIARAEKNIADRNFTLWLKHLNKDFEVEWTDSIKVPKTFFIKGYDYNGARNYIFLQDKSETRDLKVIRIDPINNSIQQFEPRRLTEMDVTNFEIIQNSAIIAGYIDGRPAAFVLNMDTKKLVTLTNVYMNKSQMLEVKINADSVTFNVAVSVPNYSRDRTVQINTYDYEGNPVRDYKIQTDLNHNLMTATTSSIFNVEQVVVGLYNYKQGTSPSGVYVNHVDRTGQQTMTYLPFGRFNEFFKHEGEKRAQKLKEKSLSAHEKGSFYRYRTEALFRKMVETDNELIIFGEYYKPWGGGSNSLASSRRVSGSEQWFPSNIGSDGIPGNNLNGVNFTDVKEYEFSHAWAFALDHSGNLLWDSGVEIDESIEGSISSFGEFAYSEGQAIYSNYYDEELIVHPLKSELDSLETIRAPLALLNEDDELVFERDGYGGILKWYQNKYLVFGIQHVRPTDKSQPTRKVFFVNGVSIGPEFIAKDLKGQ